MPIITPHVPDGLMDLMKDLAKNVLKEKPENIVEFAAEYFEKLLIERDGSSYKGYERFLFYEENLLRKEKEFIEAIIKGKYDTKNREENTIQIDGKSIPLISLKKNKRPLLGKNLRRLSGNLLVIKEAEPEEDENIENVHNKMENQKNKKMDDQQKEAANVIQQAFRVYMMKRKNKSQKEEDAAIVIQKAIRRILAVKNYKEDNIETDDSKENENESSEFTRENSKVKNAGNF